MNTLHSLGELCPVATVIDLDRQLEYIPPLRRLRSRHEPIQPEDCLVGPRCLVCMWRRQGLLNTPRTDRPRAGDDTLA